MHRTKSVDPQPKTQLRMLRQEWRKKELDSEIFIWKLNFISLEKQGTIYKMEDRDTYVQPCPI